MRRVGHTLAPAVREIYGGCSRLERQTDAACLSMRQRWWPEAAESAQLSSSPVRGSSTPADVGGVDVQPSPTTDQWSARVERAI